jgi:predicted aspartyl protease
MQRPASVTAVAWAIIALLQASAAALPARAACKLESTELSVTMDGPVPVIAAKVNGRPARFIADSGAFWDMMTAGTAQEFGLAVRPPPQSVLFFQVQGAGGTADAMLTTVKELTLTTDSHPIRNVDFVVVPGNLGNGVAGLLGQNLLRAADVEYDLAHGVIRLMHPRGCEHTQLAYWAKSEAVSSLDINFATPLSPHTTGSVLINGVNVTVMFDTGAPASLLSLKAGDRMDVRPSSAGAVFVGPITGVGGTRRVDTWVVPAASVKIGDNEEIRNTRLRVGDVNMPILRVGDAKIAIDMIIGADFFLSHRIYVASSQRKLYFTYNGGPVFDLPATPGNVTKADGATTRE